jgi:stage V sporulation protein S
MDNTVVKVAHDSRVKNVAGSIAKAVREFGRVEVRAVGAGAVNQAAKAVALATIFLQQDNISVACMLTTKVILIDGNERTTMVFTVELR